jgi:CSLREA domain-containing protein
VTPGRSLTLRTWNGIRGGLLGAIAAVLLIPGIAAAADVRVTTTADGNDKICDAHCTLREAIAAAGSNDRVIVPAGNYVLTMGELLLVSNEVIGAGARTTTIDGGNASRVLRAGDGESQVAGVTITRGNGESGASGGFGGGVFVQAGATLVMLDSAVKTNTAVRGGGIGAAGVVSLNRSTVSGNAASFLRQTSGGGVAVDPSGGLLLVNSTVTGNTASDSNGGTSSRGGGVFSAGQLAINFSTIAGNTAAEGNFHVIAPQEGTLTLINSVLAADAGDACAGTGLGSLTATNNVADDSSCQFKDPSNRQNATTALGPLANNGGPTDTRALLPASAAIDAAGACGKVTTDQRQVTRPALTGGVCDSGAYEYRAPTLRVVTNVVNDDGGTRTPSEFGVHVRLGAGDVQGSPQPGTPNGTTYTLVARSTYAVAVDAVLTYAVAVSGDCVNGSITLQEGDNRTCTITANDVPPPVAQPSVNAQQLPPPEAGRTVNALPKSGNVKVKLPGSEAFVALGEARQLPVGTIVDARKGHVTLVAAANRSGGTATAEFWAGIFRLGQTKGAAPTTVLTLVEKLSCPQAGKATIAAKKKKRRLWGDGSGKFRTKGKHSAATVVGTKWLVEDRCTSTLTRVVRGRVSVRDFVKKKTVIVRARKKYVARAR